MVGTTAQDRTTTLRTGLEHQPFYLMRRGNHPGGTSHDLHQTGDLSQLVEGKDEEKTEVVDVVRGANIHRLILTWDHLIKRNS